MVNISIKTVILTGGQSLRYNSEIPKALSIIGDKPIIHHVMDIYSSQGYNDFILALGHKKEYIINYFNQIEHNFNIKFADTGVDSNTAHRIKLVEKYIQDNNKDNHFLCSYNDGLSNIMLDKLIEHHKKLNTICTLTAVRPHHQYGILKIRNNKVIQFVEKPRMNEYISGGFFIFKNDIFDHITDNNEDLEKDVLPRLSFEGKLGAYKHEGYWTTINTIKDTINLNEELRQHGLIPWNFYSKMKI